MRPLLLGKKQMKQVAIVGRGNSWVNAPFNDPMIEIWSINDLYVFIPRADRWFEMHRKNFIDSYIPRGNPDSTKKHIDYLKTLNAPIITQQNYPDVINSQKFELEKFLRKYRKVYTSTICYMLAQAINEEYNKIYLYGVIGDKFPEQRDGIAYWIGYAEAKGIEVVISNDSLILAEKRLYGYEYDG